MCVIGHFRNMILATECDVHFQINNPTTQRGFTENHVYFLGKGTKG